MPCSNASRGEVFRGNTKYTITKGKNGSLYLNVSSVTGNAPSQKYRITSSKDDSKAKVSIPYVGDILFSSDKTMLKLLQNARKS